jgi:putative oxidoreductase
MKGISMLLKCVGRLCLAGVFLWDGIYKVLEYPAAVQFFQDVGHSSLGAQIVVVISSLVEIVFSSFLIVGYQSRFSAFALALYTLFTISLLNDFWRLDGADMMVGLIDFMKGIAIVGGLLYVMASGPGSFSRDSLKVKEID